MPVAPGAVEFRHQGYSEKEASNERVVKGIPERLGLSKSGIPKSKNSSLYWNSFPYEFIPIRKRITGVFFLEEANSISALKIRLKLPNVISYATPSPHPQPQHTSHCRSHRNTPPCLKRGSPTAPLLVINMANTCPGFSETGSLSNIRFPLSHENTWNYQALGTDALVRTMWSPWRGGHYTVTPTFQPGGAEG